MSDFGGYMDNNGDDVKRRISDHDIEAILNGGTPDDPSLTALADIVTRLDKATDVPEQVSAAHIAAAATAAREAVAVRPTTLESPASPRRRFVVRGALSGLTAKIILGTAVAFAATGGAAATGILPDPIQTVLADAAAHVGIGLPNPGLETTPTTAAPTTTLAATGTTTTIPLDADSATFVVAAGTFTWNGISCAGNQISVTYSISETGEIALDSIVGIVADVDAAGGTIRVRFTDDIEVEIRADRVEAGGWQVYKDVSQECDETTATTESDESPDGETTATTEPDESPDGETTATTEPDESPSDETDESPSDETTTTESDD